MNDQDPGGGIERGSRGALVDRFGRTKKKLRLSLTDRCNFRCVYCMPEEPAWKPRSELLTFEEMYTLAALFVDRLGIEQIRLTGGEPLVRRNAVNFIAMLGRLRSAGLKRVSLSTNGVFLGREARALKDAGLDDVNVSLDSLSSGRFSDLTGGGEVNQVLRSITQARDAGLDVKVNAVVIRGRNENDIVPLALWGYEYRLPLRLIEFMPLDARGLWSPDKVFCEKEIIAALARHFEVAAMPHSREPATYYLLNHTYPLGIISTVSNPFCADCDRIRLTADGRLFPCLFSAGGVDLRSGLRAGQASDAIEQLIRAAVWNKPRGFVDRPVHTGPPVRMHVLGG